MTSTLDRIRWPRLVAGIFLTAVIALSVHVVMLQILGVPFPDLSVIVPSFKFLIRTVATLGLIFLWQFAGQNLRWSFFKQWGALFLIATMLTETLIRGPFMEGYCTTALVFAFVSNTQKVLTIALSSAMIVAATPRLPLAWQKVVAAAAITALTVFAVSPLLGWIMGPVIQSISHLAPQSEWCVLPYGANVLAPAYLTFLEPVLGCLAAAILVWDRLSPSRRLRFAQFTLMVLAIKNQLLMPFVYAVFAKVPFLQALTSEGQFALEAIALVVLTGLTWEWSAKRKLGPA
jgi:hypothetical protein